MLIFPKLGVKFLIPCTTGLYLIKLSVHLKNGAKHSYIKKKSIYPYSPKKVQFGSLIFGVNLIFRPENALTERAVQNNQSIRTNQSGR